MEIDDPQDSLSVNDVQSVGNILESMVIDEAIANFTEDVIHPIGIDCEDSIDKELNECEKAMIQFQKERKDVYEWNCLFCRTSFIGNRSLILEHLADWHHLFLGNPDNLVYVGEFLGIIGSMLKKLQCLYCEKIFKDCSALKEHMRKKMHKRINPNNKNFDKFYMINYLNMFNDVEAESLQDADDEKEIQIEPEEDQIMCLFCDNKYSDFDEVGNHLEAVHEFDLKQVRRLSFYLQVKLINYIRHKVLLKECLVCETTFDTKESLANHMTSSRHIRLMPKRSKWNRPEYYFPTLEADSLLCKLPVDEDNFDDDDDTEIISESVLVPQSSVLMDENLRQELL